MMVNNNIFSYYSFSLYHIIYYFLRQRTISDILFDNHHHIPPLLIFLVLIAVEYGGSIRLLYCVWDCRFFLADYYFIHLLCAASILSLVVVARVVYNISNTRRRSTPTANRADYYTTANRALYYNTHTTLA